MAEHAGEFIISHGKHIAYATVAETPTYTTVDDTVEINFPESELGASETTNDSTPDFGKSYVPGLYEPGTVSFTYRFGKTQFAALETIFQLARSAGTRATATKLWKITLLDGSTGTFQGFITKHSLPAGEGEDVPTCEVEIQATTKLTFVAAA